MKILFDTNIILDVLLEREPFFEIAANLFDAVKAKIVEGYLCATTLTTIDYFLTKYRNREVANTAIKKLLKLYSVAKVDRAVLESALNSNFIDFEDAVIYYSANDSCVNGIVTRNTGDFKTAQLPIYQPDDLWALIQASTTFEWIAKELAKSFKDEVVAVYAGAGKSGLFKGEQFNTVDREVIKAAVKSREIRLVVATDAACEGLNLQTLGTLINVDLPWNPSRLEQRLGRIKRFGQARKFVDMLNLVYSETQDEKVYNVLSERLKDTYDIFGSLPDTIDDDWIQEESELEARMDAYMHERKSAVDAFSVKYRSTLDPKANLWERCSKVLSRRDIINTLSEPW